MEEVKIIKTAPELEKFDITKNGSVIGSFAVKSEGLSLLVDLLYEKRVTLEEFGHLSNEIMQGNVDIPLYLSSNAGNSRFADQIAYGIQYLQMFLDDISFNHNLYVVFSMTKDLKDFPGVWKGSDQNHKPYARIILAKPALEKPEGIYKFSYVISEPFKYGSVGIIMVEKLFYGKKISQKQRECLMSDIDQLELPEPSNAVQN